MMRYLLLSLSLTACATPLDTTQPLPPSPAAVWVESKPVETPKLEPPPLKPKAVRAAPAPVPAAPPNLPPCRPENGISEEKKIIQKLKCLEKLKELTK